MVNYIRLAGFPANSRSSTKRLLITCHSTLTPFPPTSPRFIECRISRTHPVVEGLLDPAYKLSKEAHLDEAFRVIEERCDDRRGLAE